MERILVVDDEENARIGLKKLLSRDGFQVATVANGFEALAHLDQQPVDLVITDTHCIDLHPNLGRVGAEISSVELHAIVS